jgi:hypothetical protein
MSYKILRFYKIKKGKERQPKVIKKGITLREAQIHCSDSRTKKEGEWIDGYQEE